MNKYVLSFCFVLFSMISMYSQSHKIAFSLTGGYVQDGYGGMASLDYKINEYDYLQFNIQASFSNLELEDDIEVPVDLYAFNAGFFFDVLRNNNRLFALSVGGGGVVGLENINKGDEVLESGQLLLIENQLIYGVYFGLDADIFVTPTIAVNIRANESYHINSDVGEFIPYLGAGVKLILF